MVQTFGWRSFPGWPTGTLMFFFLHPGRKAGGLVHLLSKSCMKPASGSPPIFLGIHVGAVILHALAGHTLSGAGPSFWKTQKKLKRINRVSSLGNLAGSPGTTPQGGDDRRARPTSLRRAGGRRSSAVLPGPVRRSDILKRARHHPGTGFHSPISPISWVRQNWNPRSNAVATGGKASWGPCSSFCGTCPLRPPHRCSWTCMPSWEPQGGAFTE